MGGLEIIIILGIVFGAIGTWGWSLVDILGRSDAQWKAIGQEKILWLLVILFVGLPGSLGYLLAIRPKFARIAELTGMPNYPMIAAPPPGWYPDPQGSPMMRWFDGHQWTPHCAPMGGAQPGGVQPGGVQPGGYPPSPGGYPPSSPGAPPQGPWPPA